MVLSRAVTSRCRRAAAFSALAFMRAGEPVPMAASRAAEPRMNDLRSTTQPVNSDGARSVKCTPGCQVPEMGGTPVRGSPPRETFIRAGGSSCQSTRIHAVHKLSSGRRPTSGNVRRHGHGRINGRRGARRPQHSHRVPHGHVSKPVVATFHRTPPTRRHASSHPSSHPSLITRRSILRTPHLVPRSQSLRSLQEVHVRLRESRGARFPGSSP